MCILHGGACAFLCGGVCCVLKEKEKWKHRKRGVKRQRNMNKAMPRMIMGKQKKRPTHSRCASRERLTALAGTGELSGGAPFFPVVHNPVHKRALIADIVPGLFRFNPLVFENFLSFGQKILINTRTRERL